MTQFLESLGADRETAEELANYVGRRFVAAATGDEPNALLSPELHVVAWRRYAVEAEQVGAFAALQRRLVQLRFPVQAGISQSEAYRAATRRGISTTEMPAATGLQLSRPDQLQLVIHESIAGPIPVLITGHRDDFVALLQALTHRNEPAAIPDSMGAMMVAGFNNWDRVNELKADWRAQHPGEPLAEGWAREFQENVVPNKELYQDKFILISDGPYSGVPAADLGLQDDQWRQFSVTIRMEHECTHYFTRRVFGSMQNHVLDELIADYRGIVAAVGHFRADWFLRFMGLENYPEYRPSGRLGYYRGDPPLSDKAFRVLQTLVKLAAENVERFDRPHAHQSESPQLQLRVFNALTQVTLDDLACEECPALLQQAIA